MTNTKYSWKYPSVLLLGIGVSNVGEWIYFLALNLIVYGMTGSAFAVSTLYIIRPLATILTNFWAGSIVDRINKRKLLIMMDLFRAILIGVLPFVSSLFLIYVIVFVVSMANSIFASASITYITRLIPTKKRKQFNSLHSFVTSGAFLVGPAIAGILFLIGTPIFAIYINAVALVLSALIMLRMPDIEEKMQSESYKFTLKMLKEDWFLVAKYSRNNKSIMTIYFLFSGVMVMMASAVDSLEAAFAKEVLLLSDSVYGFLVTIAGAGILVGSVFNAILVKKLALSSLIGIGPLLVSIGYIIYAFSSSFTQAGIGFFVLSFFTAAANTGFLTFYQNQVPIDMMGRINSSYDLIQSILTIGLTTILGIIAQLITIQLSVIIGVFIMFALSIILFIVTMLPSKRDLFLD